MWKCINHSLEVISDLYYIKMHCSLRGITPKMSQARLGLESFIQLANIYMDKIVSSSNTTVDYFEGP